MTEVFESDQEAIDRWRARAKFNQAQLLMLEEQLAKQRESNLDAIAERTATIIIDRIRQEDE